jgi:hypothetical protein
VWVDPDQLQPADGVPARRPRASRWVFRPPARSAATGMLAASSRTSCLPNDASKPSQVGWRCFAALVTAMAADVFA